MRGRAAADGKPLLSDVGFTDYVVTMALDFLIDGMLSGTGVRNATHGGYVEPASVGMSASLASDVELWQQKYEDAHFAGFPAELVADLDNQGIALMARADAELTEKSVGYYSNGLMKRLV